MPTNVFTTVTIGDSQYSIKKFDAKTGLKIARMVIAKAAPLIPLLEKAESKTDKPDKNVKPVKPGKSVKTDKADDSAIYEAVGSILNTLSDADVDDLVDKCLRVCYLNLPAGLAAVIDETGHYGVEDVEYDMALTIRLCIEAIKWGASDFFGGKDSALSQFLVQIGSSQNQ